MNSLEAMRSGIGLVSDQARVRKVTDDKSTLAVLNVNTSPTNLAFDIILRLSADQSLTSLHRTLMTLTALPFHADTGLFYSWYDSTTGDVAHRDVSSVDNIHLALALWAASAAYPHHAVGQIAEELLARMDFSAFYDPESGLAAGNLHFADHRWSRESWRYDYFGSEARSIYVLGKALGLFRKYTHIPDRLFWAKALDAMLLETVWKKVHGYDVEILRTWDGGTFQMLLPEILLNESAYSQKLATLFRNFSRFIIEDGQTSAFIPAAHSASSFATINDGGFGDLPVYNGKSGHLDLVATTNVDTGDHSARELWNMVVTPHAVFLAATALPERYAAILENLEDLGQGHAPLYDPHLGWMDGIHVHGKYQNQVVPLVLALDQAMIALAIQQMTAEDGRSTTGRILSADPDLRQRIAVFYELVDEKLARLVPTR